MTRISLTKVASSAWMMFILLASKSDAAEWRFLSKEDGVSTYWDSSSVIIKGDAFQVWTKDVWSPKHRLWVRAFWQDLEKKHVRQALYYANLALVTTEELKCYLVKPTRDAELAEVLFYGKNNKLLRHNSIDDGEPHGGWYAILPDTEEDLLWHAIKKKGFF